ncbi:hypothetical protein LP420_22445 [Massilia sp. B-10]|nr:hypothetical protein LP420_22445 [Massilia sp. B-10]
MSAKNLFIDNGTELQASLLAGMAKTSIHVMYSTGNGGFRKASAERINREPIAQRAPGSHGRIDSSRFERSFSQMSRRLSVHDVITIAEKDWVVLDLKHREDQAVCYS